MASVLNRKQETIEQEDKNRKAKNDRKRGDLAAEMKAELATLTQMTEVEEKSNLIEEFNNLIEELREIKQNIMDKFNELTDLLHSGSSNDMDRVTKCNDDLKRALETLEAHLELVEKAGKATSNFDGTGVVVQTIQLVREWDSLIYTRMEKKMSLELKYHNVRKEETRLQQCGVRGPALTLLHCEAEHYWKEINRLGQCDEYEKQIKLMEKSLQFLSEKINEIGFASNNVYGTLHHLVNVT